MILAANIPHHHPLRRPVQVLWLVAVEDADLLLRQLRGHRGIHVFVGTTNVVASRLQQASQRPHARSAYSDEMDFHVGRSRNTPKKAKEKDDAKQMTGRDRP